MCNSSSCNHDDLDDDLGDIFGGPSAPRTAEEIAQSEAFARAAFARPVHESRAAAAGHRYEERCPSCRGSGRFVSYSGRTVGDCFKCKGKGKLSFKTSPEQREAGRQAAERAADRKAREIREQVEIFTVEHADDFAWMTAKAGSFDFATSMLEALNKYGALTERQLATVTRLRLADAERTAARKVEAQQRAASAPVVDAGRIEEAFAHAQTKGVKKPKMILNGFKFSMAPTHGANAGALYVVRVEDDQYLGKIKEGRFMAVRECSTDEQAAVARVVNDPKGEAIAYGQRTGNCCICNRLLTNHASIDAGIGPICAERFGW